MPVFYPSFEEDNRSAFPRSRHSPAFNPGPYNWLPQHNSFRSYPRISAPLHEAPDYHHSAYNHPHYYSPSQPYLYPPSGAVAYPPDYYSKPKEGFQSPPPPYLYYTPSGVYYFPDSDRSHSAELPRWIDDYGPVGRYFESPARIAPPFPAFKLVPASDLLAGRRSLPAPASADEDSSHHVQLGYPSEWIKDGPEMYFPLSPGSKAPSRVCDWGQPHMLFPDKENGGRQPVKRSDAYKHDHTLPVVWHDGQPYAMVPLQGLAENSRKTEERAEPQQFNLTPGNGTVQSGMPFKLLPFVNEDEEDDAGTEYKPKKTSSGPVSVKSVKESPTMNGHFPILWKEGLPFIVMPSEEPIKNPASSGVQAVLPTLLKGDNTPYISMPDNFDNKSGSTSNTASQDNSIIHPASQDKSSAESNGSNGTFPILWKGGVPYLVIPTKQPQNNQQYSSANKKENGFAEETNNGKFPEKVIPVVVQTKPDDHNNSHNSSVKVDHHVSEEGVIQKPVVYVKVDDGNLKKDKPDDHNNSHNSSLKVDDHVNEAVVSLNPTIHVKVGDGNLEKDNQETRQAKKVGNGQKKTENGKKSMPPIMLKVDGGSSRKKSGSNGGSPKTVEESSSHKMSGSSGAAPKAATPYQNVETNKLEATTETNPSHFQPNAQNKKDDPAQMSMGKKDLDASKHPIDGTGSGVESSQNNLDDGANPAKHDTEGETEIRSAVSFTRDSAAVRIQSRYRGHLIKRTEPLRQLKVINNAKVKGKDIFNAFMTNPMRNNPLEKRKASEGIMGLLLQLDSIQGAIPFVRECRKSVARELSILSEQIDCIDNLCKDDSTAKSKPCMDDKQVTYSSNHAAQDASVEDHECKQDPASIPASPAKQDDGVRNSIKQAEDHEHNQSNEAVPSEYSEQDRNMKLDASEFTTQVANAEDQQYNKQHPEAVSNENYVQDNDIRDASEFTPQVANVEDNVHKQHPEVVSAINYRQDSDIRDASYFTPQVAIDEDPEYKQHTEAVCKEYYTQDSNITDSSEFFQVANVEDLEYEQPPETISGDNIKQDSDMRDVTDLTYHNDAHVLEGVANQDGVEEPDEFNMDVGQNKTESELLAVEMNDKTNFQQDYCIETVQNQNDVREDVPDMVSDCAYSVEPTNTQNRIDNTSSLDPKDSEYEGHAHAAQGVDNSEHSVKTVENDRQDVVDSAIPVGVPPLSNENNKGAPNPVTSVEEVKSQSSSMDNCHQVERNVASAPDVKSCEVRESRFDQESVSETGYEDKLEENPSLEESTNCSEINLPHVPEECSCATLPHVLDPDIEHKMQSIGTDNVSCTEEMEKQIKENTEEIQTEGKEKKAKCLEETGEQIGETVDQCTKGINASNQASEALQNLCTENSSLKELIGKLTEMNDQQANAILQLTERMKRLEQSYNKRKCTNRRGRWRPIVTKQAKA